MLNSLTQIIIETNETTLCIRLKNFSMSYKIQHKMIKKNQKVQNIIYSIYLLWTFWSYDFWIYTSNIIFQ